MTWGSDWFKAAIPYRWRNLIRVFVCSSGFFCTVKLQNFGYFFPSYPSAENESMIQRDSILIVPEHQNSTPLHPHNPTPPIYQYPPPPPLCFIWRGGGGARTAQRGREHNPHVFVCVSVSEREKQERWGQIWLADWLLWQRTKYHNGELVRGTKKNTRAHTHKNTHAHAWKMQNKQVQSWFEMQTGRKQINDNQ